MNEKEIKEQIKSEGKSGEQARPLSVVKYMKNNPGSSLGMIIAIGLSVFLIMITQMIFYSVTEGPRLGGTYTDYVTMLYPRNGGEIDKKLDEELENGEEVERIVRVQEFNTDYYHFFGTSNIKLFLVSGTDFEYVMNKMNMKLTQGRIPLENSNEIILEQRMADNKNKRIGDYMGKEVDNNEKIFGKYKIVGIMEGPSIMGLCPQTQKQPQTDASLMIFPKEGMLNRMNDRVKEIPVKDTTVWTKVNAQTNYEESTNIIQSLSSLAFVGIILVMAFTAGNSCYAQCFSQRYEYGVLQAIGYHKTQILWKAFKELLFQNVLGFSVGMLAGMGMGMILYHTFFVPRGYPFMLLQVHTLLQTLIIPVCAALFGLIPTAFLLSKIEPMIVIEKFEN